MNDFFHLARAWRWWSGCYCRGQTCPIQLLVSQTLLLGSDTAVRWRLLRPSQPFDFIRRDGIG